MLQAKRLEEANAAMAEYRRWEANPCAYQPPPGFGFEPYHVICGVPGANPPPPSAEQFTAYGAALKLSSHMSTADAEAAWNRAATLITVFGGLAGGAVLATIAAELLTAVPALATAVANFISAEITEVTYITGLTAQGAKAAMEATAQSAGELFGALAVGAVVFVIVVAAAVTAAGIWREVETAGVPVKLQKRIDETSSSLPDLSESLSTPAGLFELFGLYRQATLPDYAAERAAASTPRPFDPAIDPQWEAPNGDRTPVLVTRGWDNNLQETYSADGWFVTRRAGGTWEWALTLQYVEPNNGRLITVRPARDGFLIGYEPGLEGVRSTYIMERLPGHEVRLVGLKPPTIAVTVTDNLTEGSELRFAAVVSDPDGDADDVQVLWQLEPEAENLSRVCVDPRGGGAIPCAWPTTQGLETTKRYMRDGIWFGRAIATDADGMQTEQTFSFRVANVAPELTVDAPTSIVQGETARISGSFTDVGDDGITLHIDWGDGSPEVVQKFPCTPGPVAPDGSCSMVVLFAPAADPTAWFRTHVYATPPPTGSTYNVRVWVDDGLDTTEQRVEQEVRPSPLVIESLPPIETQQGVTTAISGRIWNPTGGPFVLHVDPGDGSPPVALGYPCQPDGVCVFSSTTSEPYVCETPCERVWFAVPQKYTTQAATPYTATVSVRRDLVLRDTKTASVTVLDPGPVAQFRTGAIPPNPDWVEVDREFVVHGRIGGDAIAGGSLHVDWGDGSTETIDYPCTDCGIGTTPLWTEPCPGGGMCAPPGPWYFELRHVYRTTGAYDIAVTATDVDGNDGPTATQSVSVTPPNTAPTVTLSGPTSVPEGSTATYAFTFDDPDSGDVIDPIETTATCGTAGSLDALSLTFHALGGQFTCRFPDGSATSDVRVDSADSRGALASSDPLTVSVTNVAPVLSIDSVTPGTRVIELGQTLSLAGSFIDPGADLDSIRIAWGDLLEYLLPAQAPGPFTSNHVYGSEGRYTVVVTVFDEGVTDVESFDVEVVPVIAPNTAPTVTLSGPTSVPEGSTATYAFTFDDPDSGDVIDPAATTATCGTAGSLVPMSLTFHASGGQFTCRFPDGAAASELRVDSADSRGALASSDPLTVSVTNVAPVLTIDSVTPGTLVPGQTLSLAAGYTDPGDDLHSISIVWGDSVEDLLFAQAPGPFTAGHRYAAEGRYTIVVTVFDEGLTDVTSIDVEVVAVPPPTASDALASVAAQLAAQPRADLTARQRRLLAEAIDLLRGRNGGAGIGAADLVTSDPVRAQRLIVAAVDRLARVPRATVWNLARSAVVTAQSIAVTRIGAAKVRTGCVSYASRTCTRTEANRLRTAESLVADGNQRLTRGQLQRAAVAYRDATISAQRA
jgi:hypothetical protein